MQSQQEQAYVGKIKEILYRLLNQETIGDDENIYEAGVTSIMVLPFLSELEDTFGLVIPDTEFLNAETPRAIGQLVQRLKAS
jgi:acyl carrier protein